MSEIDEVAVHQPVRHKWTYVEMLVSSLLSLTASLVLSIDAWKLAANPHTALSCNISATLNCGKVALAWQSTLLGWPNAFLGLMAEPVVITLAIAEGERGSRTWVHAQSEARIRVMRTVKFAAVDSSRRLLPFRSQFPPLKAHSRGGTRVERTATGGNRSQPPATQLVSHQAA